MTQRSAFVLRVRPDKIDEYVEAHTKVWPEMRQALHDAGIRNYSIFVRDNWLFAYFEYHGSDFAADMARMAADPKTFVDETGENLDPFRIWAALMTNEKPGGHGERSVAVFEEDGDDFGLFAAHRLLGGIDWTHGRTALAEPQMVLAHGVIRAQRVVIRH